MVVHTSMVAARTMINEATVTPSIPGQVSNEPSIVLLRSPLPANSSAVENKTHTHYGYTVAPGDEAILALKRCVHMVSLRLAGENEVVQ